MAANPASESGGQAHPRDGTAVEDADERTGLLPAANPSQSTHGSNIPHDGDGAGRLDHPSAERMSNLERFCDVLEIVPPPGHRAKYGGFEAKKDGDWAKILSSVWKHRLFSYGLKALAVTLVLMQSGLGITVSVLTSLQGNQAKTAVILLGAMNAFVGAIAAALQYWGQPTRESRYYASLKLVQNDVEGLIDEFKDPNTVKKPYEEAKKVMAKYRQAEADAWSNEPMIWVQNTKPPAQD